VGDYFTDSRDQCEEDIPVRQIKVHEYYDDWTNQNDICLVLLDRPANTSSQYVSTIPLPTDASDYVPGETCEVAGWDYDHNYMVKISYPLQSAEYCQAAYGFDFADSMVCAGLEAGGVGWCNGDRGAPLMCQTGRSALSGLSAWGYGCAQPGYPDVFTSTLYFLQWIHQNWDNSTERKKKYI